MATRLIPRKTDQEVGDVDLVCTGAHGAERGMSALFGSNVDRVLRQAPCPVLVARPLKPASFVSPTCDSSQRAPGTQAVTSR